MTVIRTAEEADAPAITEILNQIIRDTTITFNSLEKSPREVAQSLPEADAYLVAERDGQVLGFASFGPFRKGVGYASVKEHSICLTVDARQDGLGSALLAALEDTARSRGIRHLVAGVSGENEAGLKFHAKHGYEQVGHLPGIGQKFGRSIDLMLMQKTL